MEAGNDTANDWAILGHHETANVRATIFVQRRRNGTYRYSIEVGAPRRESPDRTHRSIRLEGAKLHDRARELSNVLSAAVTSIEEHHEQNKPPPRAEPRREDKRPSYDKPGQGLGRFRSSDAARESKPKKDKADKRVRDQQLRAQMKGK